jgi:hypothetical protein
MLWLPIIGPIIQGLFTTGANIYSKFKDTELGKLQTNRTNDLEEAKISAQIIQTTNDNITIRLCRDIICFPVACWVALVTWDTIIAETPWIDHGWMWHVASFDRTSIPYLPYVVLVFLLGNIGLNMWNRK